MVRRKNKYKEIEGIFNLTLDDISNLVKKQVDEVLSENSKSQYSRSII